MVDSVLALPLTVSYQQGQVLSPLRSLAHITDIIITHAFGNKMTHSR